MQLGRRDFLRLSGFAAAAGMLPAYGSGAKPIKALVVRHVKLPVGAESPFSLLHVSDSHVARIDSRDGDDLYAYAKSRSRIGRELGEYYLSEAVHYARTAKIKLLHTGDFMDFMSAANLEYAKRRLCTDDFLACVGNHEYWLGSRHPQTEEYKTPTIPKLKESWSGVPASTHRICGVNFFVFDDAFGTVTEEIVEAFDKTLKEGLPVVMVCHVPFWTAGQGIDVCSCGRPREGKKADLSCAFVERVRREPLVKAVLAGHAHRFLDFQFSDHSRELVAAALFNGDCTEIEFS